MLTGLIVMLPFGWPVVGGMSPPMMTTEVALAVVQLSTTGEPAEVEFGGFAVNDRICTWPTVTVALAWIWPAPLVAVKVYTVVVDGLTVAQSFAFRLVPTPGVIEMLDAFVTCQQSFVC